MFLCLTDHVTEDHCDYDGPLPYRPCDWRSLLWLRCSFALQSMRLKIIAAASSAERRFSSWIGGSILASLVSYPYVCVFVFVWERPGEMLASERYWNQYLNLQTSLLLRNYYVEQEHWLFSHFAKRKWSMMQIVMISAMFAKQVGMPETSLLPFLGLHGNML